MGVVVLVSTPLVSRRTWHLTTLLFMSFIVSFLGRISTPELILCGAELRWDMTAVSIVGARSVWNVLKTVGGKFLASEWVSPIRMTRVRTERVTLLVAPVLTVRLTGVRSRLICVGLSLVLASRWCIRVV